MNKMTIRHIVAAITLTFVATAAFAIDSLTLNLVTYNLHAGSDASVDSIAKVIAEYNPDFVALQEVDAYTMRRNASQHNGTNFLARLAAATDMFPLYGRTLNFAGGYYGIGMLSKYPCIESHVIPLPNPGAHEPRVLLEGKYLVGGDTIIFSSTHLCVESQQTRDIQARFIADHYAESEYPVLLGGDFNALPDSKAVDELSTVFTNLSGTEPTFPALAPEKKLDYLFGKCAFGVQSVDVHSVQEHPTSDHLPVAVTITIPVSK